MKKILYILLIFLTLPDILAQSKILVVGKTSENDCIRDVPKFAKADVQLQFCDFLPKETSGFQLIIFRKDCSDSEIKKCANISNIAIEGEKERLGITRLISPETAAANVCSTRLCSADEIQLAYAGACCWFEAITGINPLGNEYHPAGMRDEIVGILQLCGSAAAKNPGKTSYIDEHWYLPYIDSQWKGKKVVFFGDSITDKGQLKSCNDVYWFMLEKLLGIKSMVYGISGHQMSDILGQASSMEKEIGNDFDAIIIFVGTNDYNSSVPLGEWYTYKEERVNDHGKDTLLTRRLHNKDNNTFRGRTNIVLDSLKSRYPDKQIVLLTPIHRSWANFGGTNIQPDESFANRVGLHIEDYCTCLREASQIWSIPIIDLFAESGLHPSSKSYGQYFRCPQDNRDLLHPNTRGHIRMAYTIAYRLIAIPASFNYL